MLRLVQWEFRRKSPRTPVQEQVPQMMQLAQVRQLLLRAPQIQRMKVLVQKTTAQLHRSCRTKTQRTQQQVVPVPSQR